MVFADAIPAGVPTNESSTRERVLRVISEQGPLTTSALVEALHLTETAVRRHVDSLAADGLIATHPESRPRRRGRPAKLWVVSEAGHRSLSSDYDRLAGQALRFLAETAGPEAVATFAARRVGELESRYAVRVASAGDAVEARVEALVDALGADGFAASARPVGDPDHPGPLTGIQLCQGHCPVQHVAAEFPELCEAETEAFSRLLGVHVQRLATLAHGEHVCTTFIPTPVGRRTP